MDSEEIRRLRREKILKRAGTLEPVQEIVEKTEENSLKEQLEVIESIEHYKVNCK